MKKKLQYTEREMILYLYDENTRLKKCISELEEKLNRTCKTTKVNISNEDLWEHSLCFHDDW